MRSPVIIFFWCLSNGGTDVVSELSVPTHSTRTLLVHRLDLQLQHTEHTCFELWQLWHETGGRLYNLFRNSTPKNSVPGETPEIRPQRGSNPGGLAGHCRAWPPRYERVLVRSSFAWRRCCYVGMRSATRVSYQDSSGYVWTLSPWILYVLLHLSS
jgi:hypothetical protein